jgi:hypothetical protein
MIDVQVHCDLRIPHHADQENVLKLKASSTAFPFVPADWERRITVSMEPASLTEDFGQLELKKRLDELNPKEKLSNIASLRDVVQLIPGSRIEVVVFASDPLSGARRASRSRSFRGAASLPTPRGQTRRSRPPSPGPAN